MYAQRAISAGLTVCLILSVLMHAGGIGSLGWYFRGVTPLKDSKEPDPIVVDTITPGEVAKLRQGSRTAKLDNAEAREIPKPDEAKKEPPKPKPVAAEPPPPPPPAPEPPKEEVKPEPAKAEPPPPAAEPEKQPEPDKAALEQKLEEVAMIQAAEAQKKAEAEARAQAAAEAKAKAEADAKARAEADAKKKAEEKKKRELAEAKRKAAEKRRLEAEALAKENSKSTADRVAALLDKTPDAKQAPASAPPSLAPTKDKGPVKGAREGRDNINAANEASMLLSAIVGRIRDQGCWNIQAGGELAASQIPKIQFELNQDGSVRGEPRVLNPQGSPQFQLAADAARSAVLKCSPFPLPPDKYQMWRKVTLDFDPREMFR